MTSKYVLILLLKNVVFVFGIKYSITTSTNEIIRHDRDTIESEDGAKSITVQEEFSTFKKNLLRISDKTSLFLMSKNYELEKLEAGAFVNQEITETIVITNTQLEVIRQGTFKNLKIFELVLENNEIERVEKEAFVNLPNLYTINLSNNKLVKFSGNSFVGAPAKYFDLGFNRLEKIGPNLFIFMSDENPATILLDNNVIEDLDGAAFDGVLLETLNLRSNNLDDIPNEIFETHSDNLKTLYLQENDLKSLPESFFELTNLKLSVLSGNPLDCDTRKKLKKFAKKTQLVFEEEC